MKPTVNAAPSKRQLGQSMVEYLMICGLLVLALFVPLPGETMSVAQKVADALRKSYSALSYFLSLP